VAIAKLYSKLKGKQPELQAAQDRRPSSARGFPPMDQTRLSFLCKLTA
jgi:hypothetical protein